MIIGINGYSGSGKDTVGIIIQYLLSKPGKPSIEDVCNDYSEHEWWLDESSGWEIRKFAGKLKDVASHLTGIERDEFEDQDFKKTELGPEWTTIDYIKRYSEPFPTDDSIPVEITEVNTPMTVRDLLQKLGTDALRNGLHPNVWVNALMADYKNDDETGQLPNWIITDVRFHNEAIAIKNQGGIIIRINRTGVAPINDHPSEIGLDDWKFDYTIPNISDLFDLKISVENILKHIKVL
jgi:hypothetical protein